MKAEPCLYAHVSGCINNYQAMLCFRPAKVGERDRSHKNHKRGAWKWCDNTSSTCKILPQRHPSRSSKNSPETSPIGRRTISWCQLEAAALGHFETLRDTATLLAHGFMVSSHVITTICHLDVLNYGLHCDQSPAWNVWWSLDDLNDLTETIIYSDDHWGPYIQPIDTSPIKSPLIEIHNNNSPFTTLHRHHKKF